MGTPSEEASGKVAFKEAVSHLEDVDQSHMIGVMNNLEGGGQFFGVALSNFISETRWLEKSERIERLIEVLSPVVNNHVASLDPHDEALILNNLIDLERAPSGYNPDVWDF